MSETISQFRIIPPLYELHQAELHFRLLSGDAAMEFTVVDSGASAAMTAVGPAKLSVPGDDVGVLHNTLVRVHLPGFLRIDMPEAGQVPDVQRTAIDLLNVVIDVYRYVVNAPQIRRIPYRHARGFMSHYKTHSGETKPGPIMLGGNALNPSGQPANVSPCNPEVVQRIEQHLRAGPPPSWIVMLLDAKAEQQSNNTRSCLAHLYMAFEMLLSSQLLRLAKDADKVNEIESFLAPAGKRPPQVRAVLQRFLNLAGGSNKSTLDEFETFWSYRNDVMHGKEVDLSDDQLQMVLTQFEARATTLLSLHVLEA